MSTVATMDRPLRGPRRTAAIVVGSLVAVAASGGCNASDDGVPWASASAEVTHGQEDTKTTWVVALLTDDGFRCSGTVVSEWAVLSAAHCFYRRPVSGLQVFLGNDIGPDGPVSISFEADGKYNAKVREDGTDRIQEGTYTFYPNEEEARKAVSFVGAMASLPPGAYVLLSVDAEHSDLYRISLSADGKELTFELAANERGEGLRAGDALGKKVVVEDTDQDTAPSLGREALVGGWDRPPMRGKSIAAGPVELHPNYDPRTFAHDLAVVRLTEPAPGPYGVLPKGVLPPDTFTNGESARGRSIRVVGFGRTSTSGPGIRRSTTGQIEELLAHEYSYVASPGRQCRGDSGGPSFIDDVLVGVHSSSSEDCESGKAYDARVDQGLDFILRWTKAPAEP